MQKNFKQEYNEYVQSSVPDLWDRIEQELPVKKKKKIGKIVFYRKYLLLLSACVCLVLLIPASFVIQRESLSKSVSESAQAIAEENAADMASPMMMEVGLIEYEINAIIKEEISEGIYRIEVRKLTDEYPNEWKIGSILEVSAEGIAVKPEIEKEYKMKVVMDTEPYKITQIEEK